MTKRILIVDDHSELRKLVSMTLERGDCELREADSGERALQVVAEFRPDVVILDVMMPGNLDGYQVCERIKADPDLDATTVIMLTAKGQYADLKRGEQARADNYLVKPFSPLELIDTVEHALGAVH